jgi:hypothetical protein
MYKISKNNLSMSLLKERNVITVFTSTVCCVEYLILAIFPFVCVCFSDETPGNVLKSVH